MYECEWDKFRKKVKGLHLYKAIFDLTKRPTNRLIPRITVRGGFTEVYALKWKESDFKDEIFKYSDVNGLYPYVAMNYPFPVGKYEVIISSDLNNIYIQCNKIFYNDFEIVCGAAHVKVKPPNNLKYPFLQFRIDNEKTVLTLCSVCAKNKQVKCHHSSNRVLISSWIISDLKKALLLGYEIEEWYE